MQEVFDEKEFARGWQKRFIQNFLIGLLMAVIILVLINFFLQVIVVARVIFSVVYLIIALLLIIHFAADMAGPKADEIGYFLQKYSLPGENQYPQNL